MKEQAYQACITTIKLYLLLSRFHWRVRARPYEEKGTNQVMALKLVSINILHVYILKFHQKTLNDQV